MQHKIVKFRSLGSDVMLDKLPEGHTMSMGYMTQTYTSETKILDILMSHYRQANTQAEKDLIESIGKELGIM